MIVMSPVKLLHGDLLYLVEEVIDLLDTLHLK